MKLKNEAFTLVELLTVISLMGVLFALCFPSYRAARERAKAATCANNLRQIGIALTAYADENGVYPELQDRMDKLEQLPALDTLIFKTSTGVLRCPSDQTLFAETGTSYSWNALLSGVQPGADCLIGGTDASLTPMASEKVSKHQTSVYADGHVSAATVNISLISDE